MASCGDQGADQVKTGPAGFGRYDSDPEYVGCPFARNDMSPCIARDGRSALSGGPAELICTGCAHTPEEQIEYLARDYLPAAHLIARVMDPEDAADDFRDMVRTATGP